MNFIFYSYAQQSCLKEKNVLNGKCVFLRATHTHVLIRSISNEYRNSFASLIFGQSVLRVRSDVPFPKKKQCKNRKGIKRRTKRTLGLTLHTCDPSPQEATAGGRPEFEAGLGYIARPVF